MNCRNKIIIAACLLGSLAAACTKNVPEEGENPTEPTTMATRVTVSFDAARNINGSSVPFAITENDRHLYPGKLPVLLEIYYIYAQYAIKTL